MDQLNGFELAGRPMKVGNVTEHNPESSGGSYYDVDDMDRAGFGLGATGRIQLMAKLAEGSVQNTWLCTCVLPSGYDFLLPDLLEYYCIIL